MIVLFKRINWFLLAILAYASIFTSIVSAAGETVPLSSMMPPPTAPVGSYSTPVNTGTPASTPNVSAGNGNNLPLDFGKAIETGSDIKAAPVSEPVAPVVTATPQAVSQGVVSAPVAAVPSVQEQVAPQVEKLPKTGTTPNTTSSAMVFMIVVGVLCSIWLTVKKKYKTV